MKDIKRLTHSRRDLWKRHKSTQSPDKGIGRASRHHQHSQAAQRARVLQQAARIVRTLVTMKKLTTVRLLSDGDACVVVAQWLGVREGY